MGRTLIVLAVAFAALGAPVFGAVELAEPPEPAEAEW